MEQEHINSIKTSLAVIDEKLGGISTHLANLNGRTAKQEEKIVEIDKSVSSSQSWAKGVGVVTFLLITSLVYGYNGDRTNTKKDIDAVASKAEIVSTRAETVATDLKTYQENQDKNWNKVITRLEAIVPAEKIKKLKDEETKDEDRVALPAELDSKIPLVGGVNKNGSPKNEKAN